MEKITDNEIILNTKEGYESEEAAEKARIAKVGRNISDLALCLHRNMVRWAVYPTNVTPVTGNQCGYLAPQAFGGLKYQVLWNAPYKDVYCIETQDFGKVNIYAPVDWDSCWVRPHNLRSCQNNFYPHDPNQFTGE